MLFWPIFGNFWCPLVTLVTFNSNKKNISQKFPKIKKILKSKTVQKIQTMLKKNSKKIQKIPKKIQKSIKRNPKIKKKCQDWSKNP